MASSTSLTALSLDDFEARSGSATSIIRTITGLYIRHEKSPVARIRIVELAQAAGISAPAAQTAISRLIDRGVLEAGQLSTLGVPSAAQQMFERGTRRIFTPRQMSDADLWCLVAYSLPESLRSVRHQVRKHFLQLGGGMLGSGLWIFPEYLREEATAVLMALGAREHATLFTAQQPHFPGTPRQAASAWWDLERLAALHQAFLENTNSLDASDSTPSSAYRGYVAMVDSWRALPYLDPGLPGSMLPSQWPGDDSRERFLTLSSAFKEPALHFARSLLAS